MTRKEPRSLPWFLACIFFVLLQIGDGLSTYIVMVMTSSGPEIEANPLARYLFESIGILPGIFVVKGLAILFVCFAYIQIRNNLTSKPAKPLKLLKAVFISGLILYTVVNILNWYLFFVIWRLN